jgi:hypothetical protein
MAMRVRRDNREAKREKDEQCGRPGVSASQEFEPFAGIRTQSPATASSDGLEIAPIRDLKH